MLDDKFLVLCNQCCVCKFFVFPVWLELAILSLPFHENLCTKSINLRGLTSSECGSCEHVLSNMGSDVLYFFGIIGLKSMSFL